jgi:ATP-dependent DNA ligase
VQSTALSELKGADGDTMFRHAWKPGLEGIVAKRRDRPYRSEIRTPDAPAAMRVIE